MVKQHSNCNAILCVMADITTSVTLYTHKKLVCYLVHILLCCFASRCAKLLEQHTKCAVSTHTHLNN